MPPQNREFIKTNSIVGSCICLREVSDMVMTILNSWIVHMFERKFQKNDLSYINKDEIFCNFKNIAELLLGKYISADMKTFLFTFEEF
jgi:hypothetical protein